MFSPDHGGCWKIGDFGTASAATSKQLHTTRYSRGTMGYRAPELLDSVNPQFNNKADIFALGCIIYEILTGAKLFQDDFKINSYSNSGKLPRPIIWPTGQLGGSKRLHMLEKLVSKMLEIEPRYRPNTFTILLDLSFIKALDENEKEKAPVGGIPIQVCVSTLLPNISATCRLSLEERTIPDQPLALPTEFLFRRSSRLRTMQGRSSSDVAA